MQNFLKMAVAAATLSFASALTFGTANAGERYTAPPPVALSPDLASPWTLQLQPRKATRAERRRAQRPTRLKRQKTYSYKPVKVKRKKRIRYTGSVANSQRRVSNSGSVQTLKDPSLLPVTVNYNGSAKAGEIIVNTIERRLYLVLPGRKARRYAIGVGKPGFEWAGSHKVTRKAVWPSWTPPKEMIIRERKKGRELPAFMPGGHDNPMGARALYLGSTIYRIHGTNQAWSIGKAVSSGCIRMLNEDVMDLYERVPVGARVRVI
jgi:lipoprotein-anchoring transpeptidase ErfK/SrfK